MQDEDGSEDSDEASEGKDLALAKPKPSPDPGEDLPPRTPSSKKHDEESITSSKRDESPILRKATATLQLRSMSSLETFGDFLIQLCVSEQSIAESKHRTYC